MARVQTTQAPEATPRMWSFILMALEAPKCLTRGLTLGDLCACCVDRLGPWVQSMGTGRSSWLRCSLDNPAAQANVAVKV